MFLKESFAFTTALELISAGICDYFMEFVLHFSPSLLYKLVLQITVEFLFHFYSWHCNSAALSHNVSVCFFLLDGFHIVDGSSVST